MKHTHTESGNILFYILLAVALVGLVTFALRSGGLDGANVDNEDLLMKTVNVRQYAQELERAVTFIMNDGSNSEVDIRFAHPRAHADYGTITTTPDVQVFSAQGGGAEYRDPQAGVQNTAADWEFYGNTHLPGAGTARAELVAVLPDVTLVFCEKINEINSYSPVTPPTDDGTCIHSGAASRFDAGTQYDDTTTNTTNEISFPANLRPALQGCVNCSGTYHFFHVLHMR